MRYWSDTDGWIEAEVLWAGVGPSPAELRSREAWRQREDPTVKLGVAEKADGTLPTAREMRGKATADTPFGVVAMPNSQPQRKRAICRTCQTRFKVHDDGQCRRCHNGGVRKRPGPRPHCRNCGNRYHISELHARTRMCGFCHPGRGKAQPKERAA